jgi:hypothetical protein
VADDDLTFVIFCPDEKVDLDLDTNLKRRVDVLEADAVKKDQDHRNTVALMKSSMEDMHRQTLAREALHRQVRLELQQEIRLREILMMRVNSMQEEVEEKGRRHDKEMSAHRREDMYRMATIRDKMTQQQQELTAMKEELRVVRENLKD